MSGAITPWERSARPCGQVGAVGLHRVDRTSCDRPVRSSGDDGIIHLDPVRASDTDFGGGITPGYRPAPPLPTKSREALTLSAGGSTGLDRPGLREPVQPGEQPRGRLALEGRDLSVPGEARLAWGVTVEIEGGTKPALVARRLHRRYLEPRRVTA